MAIKEVKLKHPIKQGEETIEVLKVEHRLTAKDLRGLPLQNMMFDDMFKVLGRITAQPDSVINKIDGEDITEAMELVNSFLPRA